MAGYVLGKLGVNSWYRPENQHGGIAQYVFVK
jgi:hypothetical protein